MSIMFCDFVQRFVEWADGEERIRAAILVGSYARGAQRAGSDIDIVLLSSDKQYYVENPRIFKVFGEIHKLGVEFYGECTSIRVFYEMGLEVEFGMVPLKWIDMPLDAGTKQVLHDGYKILLDKDGVLSSITSIIPEYR